jgi:hypothetical protein
MKKFILNLSFVFLLSLFLSAIPALLFVSFSFYIAVMISALMALNAFGAVFPLYIFPSKNPLKIYITSMAIRVILLGFLLVFFYYQIHLNTVVFFTTCMVAYVLYQSIEIYHLSQNKTLFSTPK